MLHYSRVSPIVAVISTLYFSIAAVGPVPAMTDLKFFFKIFVGVQNFRRGAKKETGCKNRKNGLQKQKKVFTLSINRAPYMRWPRGPNCRCDLRRTKVSALGRNLRSSAVDVDWHSVVNHPDTACTDVLETVSVS